MWLFHKHPRNEQSVQAFLNAIVGIKHWTIHIACARARSRTLLDMIMFGPDLPLEGQRWKKKGSRGIHGRRQQQQHHSGHTF